MDAMHEQGHEPRKSTASRILWGSMKDHDSDTHAGMTQNAVPAARVDLPEHAVPGHDDHAAAGHDSHAGGHDKHAGHSVAMFRDRFWLSLLLTIPVVLLSPDVAMWLGYEIPMIPGLEYLPAILGTIVFLYGGMVFLRGAAGEVRDRQPGMMTLISLAIVVAFVTSWAGTLGLFEVEIWWELATLITIMLLGHWLEMRSIAQARGALAALADLLPDTAERVTAGGTETVALAALAVGDVVLVRPGGRVPVDGTVTDGAADLDESLITGESRAVSKGPAMRSSRGPSPPADRSGCASPRRGKAPPSRGSCAWSPRPRPPRRGPRPSPTGRPPSCSTSRSPPVP